MTILWNEVTILWNEVTIWWNEVTKGWNEVAWNEVVMERSDRNSLLALSVKYRSALAEFIRVLKYAKEN